MNTDPQSLKPSEDQPSGATNGRAAHTLADTTLLEGPAQRLHAVETRILRACQAAGRDRQTVKLIAVSKTKPAVMVMELAAKGQIDFGENYLQEGIEKIAQCKQAMPLHAFVWHFIGPIQSNKTRPIAEHFDWVHSVERLKIAQRLSEQRLPTAMPLNVCIQVNVSEESTKSGCPANEALELIRACQALKGIKVRGLMAIPEPGPQAVLSFQSMRTLFQQIKHDLPLDQATAFDTLSMGMSEDLETAIANASTMVRIGTALFGARS